MACPARSWRGWWAAWRNERNQQRAGWPWELFDQAELLPQASLAMSPPDCQRADLQLHIFPPASLGVWLGAPGDRLRSPEAARTPDRPPQETQAVSQRFRASSIPSVLIASHTGWGTACDPDLLRRAGQPRAWSAMSVSPPTSGSCPQG